MATNIPGTPHFSFLSLPLVPMQCRGFDPLHLIDPRAPHDILAKVQFGAGISRVVECPKGMVGRVIGKGGETIKALQVRPP